MKTLLHSVYDQPDADSVHAQYDRIVDALAAKLPKVAEHLKVARVDLLAFTAFGEADLVPDLVQQPAGAANKEIRCRTDVVGIFPDRTVLIRLVGAALAQQRDEWIEVRRYLGLHVLARSRTYKSADSVTEGTVIPPRQIGTYELFRNGQLLYISRSDTDLRRRLTQHALAHRAEFFTFDVQWPVLAEGGVEICAWRSLCDARSGAWSVLTRGKEEAAGEEPMP